MEMTSEKLQGYVQFNQILIKMGFRNNNEVIKHRIKFILNSPLLLFFFLHRCPEQLTTIHFSTFFS